MNSYENEIMNILEGNTPREKYDFLQRLLDKNKAPNLGVEIELLNVCLYLNDIGEAEFKTSGTESYVRRCNIHDAKQLIYNLTSKSKSIPMHEHKRKK